MIRTIALLITVAVLGGDDQKDTPKDQPTVKRYLPAHWYKLGLSEAQRQKVYDTLVEYKTKTDELTNQIRDLEIKEREELQKILTDAQKARLREVLAERSAPNDDKKPESKPDPKKP
jgi:hypothetical protein